MTHAIRLDGLLHDIEDVKSIDDALKLYFGVIKNSCVMGQGQDHNVRMTQLRCNGEVGDLTLKTLEGALKERGPTSDSKGRIVLAYGRISTNGTIGRGP